MSNLYEIKVTVDSDLVKTEAVVKKMREMGYNERTTSRADDKARHSVYGYRDGRLTFDTFECTYLDGKRDFIYTAEEFLGLPIPRRHSELMVKYALDSSLVLEARGSITDPWFVIDTPSWFDDWEYREKVLPVMDLPDDVLTSVAAWVASGAMADYLKTHDPHGFTLAEAV